MPAQNTYSSIWELSTCFWTQTGTNFVELYISGSCDLVQQQHFPYMCLLQVILNNDCQVQVADVLCGDNRQFLLLLGRCTKQSIRPAVGVLVQLSPRVQHICDGTKDANGSSSAAAKGPACPACHRDRYSQ